MRARNLDAQKKPLATRTIVVAAKPLRFGNEVGAMSLREVPWPADALPAGAFSKIAELTSARHVVLTAIEANEPVLASKITGSGQRATLSAMPAVLVVVIIVVPGVPAPPSLAELSVGTRILPRRYPADHGVSL